MGERDQVAPGSGMTAFYERTPRPNLPTLYTGFSAGSYRSPDNTSQCAACEDGDCPSHYTEDIPQGGDRAALDSLGHPLDSRFYVELDGRRVWRANPVHFYGNGKA